MKSRTKHMNDFITIATFTLPSELVIARSKLESEGIECKTLDELTVQSYNFLSNAVGGVKLQVRSSDKDRATALLKAGGFIKETEPELSFLEKYLANSSNFKKINRWIKMIAVLVVMIFLAIIVYYWINRPSVTQRLVYQNWCLDYIVYQNEIYYPYTIYPDDKIRISGLGECEEFITFDTLGNVLLPGFDTEAIKGKWKYQDRQISLSQLDTLQEIFQKNYNLFMKRRSMTLISDSLEIYFSNDLYNSMSTVWF